MSCLYTAEKQIFGSYDDPEPLTLKCKYVLTYILGGIMFWNYESDSTGALLNAVNDAFKRNSDSQDKTK